MNRYQSCIILILLTLAISSCGKEPPDVIDNTNPYDHLYGEATLEFPVDDQHVPERCIRKADLSLAFTADSLYRKEFYTKANVSEYQSIYSFSLSPRQYFYQAGKICICGGDTCLWGGYPGGQNGTRWTMGWFTVEKGKTVHQRIKFD